MHLYKCFRFSKVMDHMFLKVRVAMQDSFKATVGVAARSVFVMVPSHPTPSCIFLLVNLDYPDFSGGIFDL